MISRKSLQFRKVTVECSKALWCLRKVVVLFEGPLYSISKQSLWRLVIWLNGSLLNWSKVCLFLRTINCFDLQLIRLSTALPLMGRTANRTSQMFPSANCRQVKNKTSPQLSLVLPEYSWFQSSWIQQKRNFCCHRILSKKTREDAFEDGFCLFQKKRFDGMKHCCLSRTRPFRIQSFFHRVVQLKASKKQK